MQTNRKHVRTLLRGRDLAVVDLAMVKDSGAKCHNVALEQNEGDSIIKRP